MAKNKNKVAFKANPISATPKKNNPNISNPNKKTILVLSDSPVVTTGFGKVIYNFVTRWLQTGKYRIVCMGTNDRGEFHPLKNAHPDLIIEPLPYISEDAYGAQALPHMLRKYDPDCVFMLNDVWVWTTDERTPHMNNWPLKAIREFKAYIPLVLYVAIDAWNMDRRWIDFCNEADYTVAFSDYGEKVLKAFPALNQDKVRKVYHGHDTENFFPLSKDEWMPIRKNMGIPEDAFVVGFVGRNQNRKAVPQLIYAFKMFKDGYVVCDSCSNYRSLDVVDFCQYCGDTNYTQGREGIKNSYLYMHTHPMDQRGWRLPKIVMDNKLDNVVTLPTNFDVAHGVPIEELNKIYNAMDVHVNPAYGGGYELCSPFDTNILAKHGLDKVQNIKVGDKLLTHSGNFESVTKIYERDFNGDLINIDYGTTKRQTNKLSLTPNHPVAIIPKDKEHDYKNLTWKNAEDVAVGDYVITPKIRRIHKQKVIDITKYSGNMNYVFIDDLVSTKGCYRSNFSPVKHYANKMRYSYSKAEKCLQKTHTNSILVERAQEWKDEVNYEFIKRVWCNRYIDISSEDFGQLLGFFLAEGSTCETNKSVLEFTFHEKEIEYHKFVLDKMLEIFGIDGSMKLKNKDGNGPKTMSIMFYNKIVSQFFRQFGENSLNKCIPIDFFDYISPNAVLCGLFKGDGYYNIKNLFKDSIKCSTISKKLSGQINILLNMCGIFSKMSSSIKHHKNRIYINRISKQSDKLYMMNNIINEKFSYKESVKKNLQERKQDELFYYQKVQSIAKEPYDGKVYNFEVDKDHTYVIEDAVVHNCTAESLAVGTPNVATRTTAITEQLEDGRGYLVNASEVFIPNDAFHGMKHMISTKDLVDTLYHIYDNPEEAAAKKEPGIAFAKSRNWTDSAKQMESIIDDAIKSRIELHKLLDKDRQNILIVNTSDDAGDILSMVPALKALEARDGERALFVLAVKEKHLPLLDALEDNNMAVINLQKMWLDHKALQGFALQSNDITGGTDQYINAGMLFNPSQTPSHIQAYSLIFRVPLDNFKLSEEMYVFNNEDLVKAEELIQPSEEKFDVTLLLGKGDRVPEKNIGLFCEFMARFDDIKMNCVVPEDKIKSYNFDASVNVVPHKDYKETIAIMEKSDCVITSSVEFAKFSAFINTPFLLLTGPKPAVHVLRHSKFKLGDAPLFEVINTPNVTNDTLQITHGEMVGKILNIKNQIQP